MHEGVWIDNLYINRAIVLKKGYHFKFKGLLTKYLKSDITSAEQALLLQIVSKEDLARIKSAYDEKEKAIQLYKDENLRNADQQELIDFINRHDEYDIEYFDAEFLQILANADIMSLLKDEILDLGVLSDISTDVLKELLYENSVIEELAEENITFQDLLEIYNAVKHRGAIFSDVFEDFISAINNRELSVSEIIQRYIEDSMHLMFMMGDPTDVVLENSDDELIVRFGIENYDVDVAWIREELHGEKDDFSAALMDFDRMIGTYDDYEEDQDSLGNYEDYDEGY